MSHFLLVPTDQACAPLNFNDSDICAAFNVVHRRGIAEADIWRDDDYFCTMRLSSSNKAGFWTIFQKVDFAAAVNCSSSLMVEAVTEPKLSAATVLRPSARSGNPLTA